LGFDRNKDKKGKKGIGGYYGKKFSWRPMKRRGFFFVFRGKWRRKKSRGEVFAWAVEKRSSYKGRKVKVPTRCGGGEDETGGEENTFVWAEAVINNHKREKNCGPTLSPRSRQAEKSCLRSGNMQEGGGGGGGMYYKQSRKNGLCINYRRKA